MFLQLVHTDGVVQAESEKNKGGGVEGGRRAKKKTTISFRFVFYWVSVRTIRNRAPPHKLRRNNRRWRFVAAAPRYFDWKFLFSPSVFFREQFVSRTQVKQSPKRPEEEPENEVKRKKRRRVRSAPHILSHTRTHTKRR